MTGERPISRRCLICSNINPCTQHSNRVQEDELARNIVAVKNIQGGEATVLMNTESRVVQSLIADQAERFLGEKL